MEKKVILVVDDEQAYINHIIEILSPRGYKILQAPNGKIGCMVAQKFIPDIIITDWEMPEMSGIEATRQLKLDETTCDIPVIIATGVMIKPANLSTALSAGAIDFLRKPVDETELIARVESALCLAKAHSKIKQQNQELQKQLTSNLLKIQQLNELKHSISLHLDKVKQLSDQEDISEIKKIASSASEILKSKMYEIDWSEFESHFDMVNHGFISKLKSQYNELTDYDLRLCAFIKLKMNSKEISQIIYTSPDSVDTARKRLKKKLGLTAEQNLQVFISEI